MVVNGVEFHKGDWLLVRYEDETVAHCYDGTGFDGDVLERITPRVHERAREICGEIARRKEIHSDPIEVLILETIIGVIRVQVLDE